MEDLLNKVEECGAEPTERMINAGLQALLQCTSSELENYSHILMEDYTQEVTRVYKAMKSVALSLSPSEQCPSEPKKFKVEKVPMDRFENAAADYILELKVVLENSVKNADRYERLRGWMSSNVPEGWDQVKQLAAIACYIDWDTFDTTLDLMGVCNVGLMQKTTNPPVSERPEDKPC